MHKAGSSQPYDSPGSRERGKSLHRSRRARQSTPYERPSGNDHLGKPTEALLKIQAAWNELCCPICMEPPHNAVLLVCEQHEKGCSPYMCDTSHRHSNCLDQFRKACSGHSHSVEAPANNGHSFSTGRLRAMPLGPVVSLGHLPRSFSLSVQGQGRDDRENMEMNWRLDDVGLDEHFRRGDDGPLAGHGTSLLQQSQEEGMRQPRAESQGLPGTEAQVSASDTGDEGVGEAVAAVEKNRLLDKVKAAGEIFTQAEAGLLCPLCRTRVLGWKVVIDVRSYLNQKQRACSRESCGFAGAYATLRSHAREEHPLVRPQEADPERVAGWRRLQHQQDREDVMSTIRSLMPGARVYGDYLIEDEMDLDMDPIHESDSDDMAGPDIDMILPMLEVMRDLATAGPSHQQGRLPWGLGIGPRPIRRRPIVGRNRARIGSASFSASLPRPVNFHTALGSPPRFPELPPVPLGGAMPLGDLDDDVVPRRSRWGEITDWRDRAGRNGLGHDVGGGADPWTPGVMTGINRELLDRRRRLVAEAIRERLSIRRGREDPVHPNAFNDDPQDDS